VSKLTMATKGDLLVTSKHADVSLVDRENYSLYWFDTPIKGKCLGVEYISMNWPSLVVNIEANWKQKRYIKRLKAKGWLEQKF